MLIFRLLAGLITIPIAWGLALMGQGNVAHWLVAGVSAVVLIPNVINMIRTVREGGFGVDILALVAVTASVALREDTAALVIIVMMVTGEALEAYAERRAKTELTALTTRSPKYAHVWRGHELVDLPADQIKVGDEITIKPGEVVPVDAKLTEGSSSFDEAALTGESLPVSKTVGAEVLSGSVNLDGLVQAHALRTSSASQYEQIVQMVQDAASRRSPLVRLADRYSLPFTLVSFTIAGLAWAVSGQPIRALEVLVVATPCPLLIAAPVAIVSGMSRAAGAGIIAKSGAALERLSRIRTVAFDKTGTLTQGRPEVLGVQAHKPFTAQAVLAAAASLEQGSTHVLAAAIVRAATEQTLELQHATALHEDPGHGLRGHLKGRPVIIGRLAYLTASGVTVPETVRHTQTATLVAIGGHYAGAITFTDHLRPEAKTVMHDLRQAGIVHLTVLTGDHAAAAQRIARQLGIRDVRADCLPGDKVQAIKHLAPSLRPVAMVGDGVNDAPTLAASDVGIALGAKGSTAASQSADVVIMLDDLGRVPLAINLARQAITIATQSIFIGIGLSVVLMLIATTGLVPPVVGALLQEGVDVAVILNALRARSIH